MTDRDSRPPTFADACEAVLSDPEGAHSADTTLAPLAARAVPEGWGERRARLVASRLPTDVDRVLELGSGVGALLRRLGERYDAVGVDDRRAHLRFSAARGEAVVRGDPTRLPVGPAFDGVCAVEDAVARASAVDVCVAAYGALRPGGIVVVAAPTDPSAVAEPGVETYSGSRYLLERAVDVVEGTSTARRTQSDDVVSERSAEASRTASGNAVAEAVVDYRITDRRTGDSAVVTETRSVATTDPDGLTAALRTAGFEDVLVAGESDLPGVVVGRGVRPVETGE